MKRNASFEKPVSAIEPHVTDNSTIDKRRKLEHVERKKSRSQSISMSIFVVFIMIITVMIILRVMKSSAPKPQFMFIQEGTIENSINTEALFIRDEMILKSPDNGYLKPVIQAGNRVAFGQTAASVMKEGSDENLVTLKNYEKQIAELRNELMLDGKGPGAKEIYDEANEDISAQIDIIRRDVLNGVFAGSAINKSSIEIAMQRRESRLVSIDFKDSRLDELKRRKQQLEDKLEIIAGHITIQTPGIVSYSIDGLEEVLIPPDSDKLSIDEYKEYLKNTSKESTIGKYLETDDAALKVITGIYQHIAVSLPASQDSDFAEETIHTLNVPDKGVVIDGCKVVRKLVQGDDVLVIFKTDRQLSRFSDYRTIGVSLSTSVTRGSRIPYSAIFEISDDGKNGKIMIVINGYARKLNVNIVVHDSDYAIIEASEETDAKMLQNGYLVKNPSSVEEGENLGT